MKNIPFLLLSLTFIFLNNLFGQAPQFFSFQTTVRDGQNNLIKEKNISFKMSIIKNTDSGTIVFSEKHNVITNLNGLATLKIGDGANITGNFSQINWGNGIYFIKTEVDIENNNSFEIQGVSQLLSVPYALYSEMSRRTSKIVDHVPTKNSDWQYTVLPSGFSYYTYEYVNPAITQDVLDNGNIQVFSLYNPGNYYQTWPFNSRSNGASYNVIVSLGKIILRAEEAPSAPVTEYKIVITP